MINVHGNDDQRCAHIDHGHDGYDLVGYFGDTFNPANDHDPYQHRQPDSEPGSVFFDAGNHISQLGKGLVCLEHVTAAERSSDNQQSKQSGQKPAQPFQLLLL